MALRSPHLPAACPAVAAGSQQAIRQPEAAAPRPACRRRQRRSPPLVCSAAADAPAAGGLLALKEWAPTCAAIAAGEQTILLRKGGIKDPKFVPAARSFLLFPTAFHTDAQLLKPAAAQRYAAEAALDPKTLQQLTFGVRCTITGGWAMPAPLPSLPPAVRLPSSSAPRARPKPRLRARSCTAGAWTTHDPSVLALLDELHVWGPNFLEARRGLAGVRRAGA